VQRLVDDLNERVADGFDAQQDTTDGLDEKIGVVQETQKKSKQRSTITSRNTRTISRNSRR
jgi:hypothetical protein